MSPDATFYTVTDAEFFPGTVALLNSLRLVGHREPLVVLDNGLTAEQRGRLERVATVVDIPGGSGSMPPPTLKPFPHLFDATGTVAIIDSDMIVSASLAPALSLAGEGKICLYAAPDWPSDRARWFAEWHEVFALRAPLRREPYLNNGFVVFSADHWPSLLEDWWTACSRIPAGSVFTSQEHALRLGDSDALNAILMSEVEPGWVVLPPDGLQAAPGDEVVVADEDRLVCLRDGVRVSLLHHWARPKVWSREGMVRLGTPDPYVGLFPRVAFGRDAALPLAPSDVPWWLRPGIGFTLTERCGTWLAALARGRRAAGSLVSASARHLRGSG
jgi:hypothetical protein